MSAALIFLLTVLKLISLRNINQSMLESDTVYHELPRFWTNTGFCPAGSINHGNITAALLSDAVQMNLRYIAALPNGAITHVRIHWLLELIEFVQFTQAGVPIYDFTDLDTFILYLDELGLYPVVEFMANPGDVFNKNPNLNDFLWEDFAFQVTKRYLNILGAAKMLHWRFESWNEPDLANYNKLNFNIENFLVYLHSLHDGLVAAGRRPVNSLHFQLRGPAGLFKAQAKHPLCWKALHQCNLNTTHCPFYVLTYHRKGNGTAASIIKASSTLLHTIHKRFPLLRSFPVSNDEADPASGWSKPRQFQANVQYAVRLVSAVLYHWNAKLQLEEFANLESISHDNAFLSYHPHEFTQRTLLAHFRMNDTIPPHSQFIQKPVFAALALLSKLGSLAVAAEDVVTPQNATVQLLRTKSIYKSAQYIAWLVFTKEGTSTNVRNLKNFTLNCHLPAQSDLTANAYIVEVVETQLTDPMYVWRSYKSPSYPNATVREQMRRSQSPKLHANGLFLGTILELFVEDFTAPWLLLLRICSSSMPPPKKPIQMTTTEVTHSEVLLTWREVANSTECLKTYEVWFSTNNATNWQHITTDWHTPFPIFHYAPTNAEVNGFYKVRAVDIFNRTGEFSEVVEYIEI